MFSPELRKGSIELLILSILEARPHHGYEIGKQIVERSSGRIEFRVSSLYPVLSRLERCGHIRGRWVEAAGERRRRFYRLTAGGRRELARKHSHWNDYVDAMRDVLEGRHA